MLLMSTLLDLRARVVVEGREFSGVLGEEEEEEAFSIAGLEEEKEEDDDVAGVGVVVVVDFLEEETEDEEIDVWTPPSTSETMMPKIQQLMMKNARPAAKSPGTNVLRPRNSSWYPCWSQAAWPRIQSTNAVAPRVGRAVRDDRGRYSGRKIRYHRKY